MTQDRVLLVRREGSIATITLNRPECGNALNAEMAHALLAETIRCDNDDSIRCVVLTGAGRMFCSGGDVREFLAAGQEISAIVSKGTYLLHTALAKLARMEKPLLVLVNGPAAGAGLSIALTGDIVIAASCAHFTAGYSAIGLTPDGGMTWRLPKLIGLRRAQEMILTNRQVSAEEAAMIGLVTRIVDDEALRDKRRSIAADLASAAIGAIGVARSLLLESFGNNLETQMELEARAITRASFKAEAHEGLAAFRDRRKPQYKHIGFETAPITRTATPTDQ